jgi:hypothetical protein
MEIVFRLETDLFRNEEFEVKGEWSFSTLPRMEEKIHPLLVINQKEFDIEKFKKEIIEEERERIEEIEGKKKILKDFIHDLLEDAMFWKIKDIKYIPAGKDSTSVIPLIIIK